MWSTHSRRIEPIRQAYRTGLTLADALKHSIDVEAPRSRLQAPTSTRMARQDGQSKAEQPDHPASLGDSNTVLG
jgi:hypothetical protein